MDIGQLNRDHGIAEHVKFVLGAGGLPFIMVDNAKASALVSIYGGQVLSFQPANEQNLMFLSEASYYEAGKGIKGGTPICWPWFGPDPEKQGRGVHGFARNRFWNVLGTQTTANGDNKITLALTDTPETRTIWPRSFYLSLEITIGNTLNLELVTHNTDSAPLSITQALHTYFKVGNINEVTVLGLEGVEYLDKVDNYAQKLQTGAITIDGEVDRIYQGVPSDLVIDDIALDRRIRIKSSGSKTSVVWNPWKKIAAEMGDLKDDDYQRFVCVETANAGSEVIEMVPGSEYRLAANYRIERDTPELRLKPAA
jgi:glucose-6-phosphate 1-epimerase